MIEQYGWSAALQQQFAAIAQEDWVPARIVAQHRDFYRIVTRAGEMGARLAGRFAFSAGEAAYPVAGDWVAASLRPGERAATIHHLLARRTAFVRRAAFSQAPQIVAANIDAVLIVAALDGDLNPRRLERALSLARESGASPAIILTKADLAADADAGAKLAMALAGGAPVLAVSAVSGAGMAALAALVPAGTTAVVLGSSGAGKSTLVNALGGGALMATGGLRADGRGRHTTTHRELVLLPQGGCILDTPGMREMGMWDAEAGLAATFADIGALAGQCRFRDCTHAAEPGCAVRDALADGRLDPARWHGYRKLQRELLDTERLTRQIPPADRRSRRAKPATRRHLERDPDED